MVRNRAARCLRLAIAAAVTARNPIEGQTAYLKLAHTLKSRAEPADD
jgi:hypothetical protein